MNEAPAGRAGQTTGADPPRRRVRPRAGEATQAKALVAAGGGGRSGGRLIHADRPNVEAGHDELARLVCELRRVEVVGLLDEGLGPDEPLIWKNGGRPYPTLDLRVEQGEVVARIQPP